MKTENELIAEFMGGVRRTRVAVFADKDYDVYEFKHGNNPNPHANIGTEKRIEDLDYHKRWDWLMPVVEKINSTVTKYGHTDVIIYRNTCHVNDPEQIIIETIGKNMLECTYKAVVEFIQWYNTQQPPQKSQPSTPTLSPNELDPSSGQ